MPRSLFAVLPDFTLRLYLKLRIPKSEGERREYDHLGAPKLTLIMDIFHKVLPAAATEVPRESAIIKKVESLDQEASPILIEINYIIYHQIRGIFAFVELECVQDEVLHLDGGVKSFFDGQLRCVLCSIGTTVEDFLFNLAKLLLFWK